MAASAKPKKSVRPQRPAKAGKEATQPKPASPGAYVEPAVPTSSIWTRIDKPFSFGFLGTLGVLAALLLGGAISSLSTILMYLAIALFLALGVMPAIEWLIRHKLPRGGAVVIVFLALLAVIGGIIAIIVPIVVEQISAFAKAVPGLVNDFMASDLYHRLESVFGEQLDNIVGEVQKFLGNPSNIAVIGGGAIQVGVSIANGLSGTFIVFILTLYFASTLPSIKSGMLRLAPARNRERISDISHQIAVSVGGYVVGMVTLAGANAVFVLIMFTVLGLPFALLMAVVAFLITLIPMIGSVLFWVIGSVLALFSGLVPAIIFAVAYLAYMQVESYVLTPRIMNRAVSIPGLLVMIAALVGGTLMGLLGALVAIPVAAALLLIVQQVWIPRQDAKR